MVMLGFILSRYLKWGLEIIRICVDLGPIWVQFSGKCQSWCLPGGVVQLSPKLAYRDYLKDLDMHKIYQTSFTEYMECIIGELLVRADKQGSTVT